MSNDDVHAEITALREQVEALTARQESMGRSPSAGLSEELKERVDLDELRGKAEDVLQRTQQAMKETPLASSVAFFAIGFVVGRFLAK